MMGLVIACTVSAASIQDQDSAAAVAAQACSTPPELEKFYIDSAYSGKCARYIEQLHHIRVEIVRHPANGSTGSLYSPEQATLPTAEMSFGVAR
jgi:putative transposase